MISLSYSISQGFNEGIPANRFATDTSAAAEKSARGTTQPAPATSSLIHRGGSQQPAAVHSLTFVDAFAEIVTGSPLCGYLQGNNCVRSLSHLE